MPNKLFKFQSTFSMICAIKRGCAIVEKINIVTDMVIPDKPSQVIISRDIEYAG